MQLYPKRVIVSWYNMQMEPVQTIYNPSKAVGKVGIIAGLLGGFVFSSLAWGMDAISLAGSHVVFPWIKVIPATIVVTLLAGLCGYFSAKSGRGSISFILWVGWAIGCSLVASSIPFRWMEWIIRQLNPLLGAEINYPIPPLQDTRIIFSVCVVIVLGVIVSLLFPTIVEQIHMAMYIGPMVMNVTLWLALFVGMGFMMDEVYNKPLRRPLNLTSDTIDVARANKALFDHGKEASKLQILAMKPLMDVIDKPYHIALKTYEDLNESMEVLVDFDGFWYTCNVAYSQVINCK